MLAAGKGTRMHSARPKVLHALAGQSLLGHVLNAAREVATQPIRVVVGADMDAVVTALPGDDIDWIEQPDRKSVV